ncbi:MAG: phosphoenolpyruvate synthase [Pseudomonadota bacterium]|nr:phosphoenolpyruvate synthase [Gammaproteobacteria bacterium]MEE2683506.1 phosphoenolpyruvate synthase [Pseudomonadota bacterium]
MTNHIISLSDCRISDINLVGGKNASLGEMIGNLNKLGVDVPGGFAITADAYKQFIAQNNLDKQIYSLLDSLDASNINELNKIGNQIRSMILKQEFPEELVKSIESSWLALKANKEIEVAVRSSATAEDLPEASFAGQQETLLNVSDFNQLLDSIKEVYSSLFNDRAISYRLHQNFDHRQVSISVGVQHMIRSDLGSSGVMFTLDTESGFDGVVFITSSYGLGETIVQGSVNPDEFYVYKDGLKNKKNSILRKNLGSKATKMIFSTNKEKRVEIVDVETSDQKRFSLEDSDIIELARQAMIIENHYKRPMDIEWGKDGSDGNIYILQARPETVQSRHNFSTVRYSMKEKSEVITQGRSIGQKISSGVAKVIDSVSEMDLIQKGDVLVADMTDPDWEPIMKIASAIVTNRGGRTCHAAIIARELGIPAVVGCEDATKKIKNGQPVTVSCAEGNDGFVYKGKLEYQEKELLVNALPEIPIKIMMNVANPDKAFSFSNIPNHGVGLARLEFIINRMIGVHPKALLEIDDQDLEVKDLITNQMSGYSDPKSFYISKLSEGISCIAAAFSPKPVIVRMSDFKSNEYANLIGGKRYEPYEENPMLGYRGASRYVSKDFKECFEMECEAIKYCRNKMGLTNIQIMVPFVRTLDESKNVIEILKNNGLIRGENDLKIIMMCELPSNALLAEEFLEYFDGMSIGSNDMTQLTIGLDRDSSKIANLFDERDPAVKKMLSSAINACNEKNKYIGICGQGPSDYPDFANWLVKEGIQSISLNPDSVIDTWIYLSKN